MRQKTLIAILGMLLLPAVVLARVEPPAPPAPEEIDAQYNAVLSAMKHPVANGVLVTEIGPASPAGIAGLKAGDVIIQLHGAEVRTLAVLRDEVAELVASNIASNRQDKVILVVRRATIAKEKNAETQPAAQTLRFDVPREPLGIRAIEVEAGTPAKLNPPPSVRGSITMAWDEVRKLQNAGGDLGQKTFLRNTEGDGLWLGWTMRSADPASDDEFSGTVDVFHIAVGDKEADIVRSESVGFTLRTGDYATAPAFLLESVDVTNHPGDGTVVTITASRTGNKFSNETILRSPERIEGPFKVQRETPVTAIVPGAVPLVASAMPQQKDAVIALQLMSIRDFVARPGYVLAARGKQEIPPGDAGTGKKIAAVQAWRVDLVHCGLIVESYWFTDQRRLLRTDSFGGTPLTSRRVSTEQEARSTAEEKPLPLTRPAATTTAPAP